LNFASAMSLEMSLGATLVPVYLNDTPDLFTFLVFFSPQVVSVAVPYTFPSVVPNHAGRVDDLLSGAPPRGRTAA
jgi:hypothetical protein